MLRLLLNLAENSKTRSELITLLVLRLAEDTDPSLKKAKGKAVANQGKKGKTDVSDSIPNLVSQRCLEVLQSLATNEQVLRFFLQENESFGSLFGKGKASRKGKEKEVPFKIPFIILLYLLDRPLFL